MIGYATRVNLLTSLLFTPPVKNQPPALGIFAVENVMLASMGERFLTGRRVDGVFTIFRRMSKLLMAEIGTETEAEKTGSLFDFFLLVRADNLAAQTSGTAENSSGAGTEFSGGGPAEWGSWVREEH